MGYQAHLPDLALGQRWAKGYYAQALNQTVLTTLLPLSAPARVPILIPPLANCQPSFAQRLSSFLHTTFMQVE